MGRILFFLSIGVGGAAILISLGVWQVQRLAWKEVLLDDIATRIDAAPVALPAAPDREAHKYLPVAINGTVQAGALFVLVSQKQIGAGYRVISPFETEDGRRILLDRGFVKVAARGAVDTAPRAMTVQGNLHWPQETDDYTPEPDATRQIHFARDVDLFAAELGTDPIMVVARQTSQLDAPVTPLPVDTAGIPNDHLQYAITWFSLALIWVAMTLYFVLRGTRSPAKSEET